MKKSLILSVVVFVFTLYVNLSFIWDDGNDGLSGFGLFFIGIFFYLFLAFAQIPLLISLKNKFELKKGLLLSINVICLIIIFIYPTGIYYPKEKRIPYLIAFNEGAVNCTTTLSLFKNNEFKEVNICFGKTTTRGKFEIVNDTIIFEVESLGNNINEFYKYAIIEEKELKRYYANDSLRRGSLNIKELNID